MPKISVIVPNYNHARFLPERLDSILAQTLQPDEIILLDDASSDGSRQILEKYAALYPDLISCHFNENNSGGAFAQWKKGVGLASGDFIWLAESDDVAEPRLLETLLPMLESNPKVGVAYCQSYMIGPDGQKMGDLQYRTDELDSERWRSQFTNNGREECSKYLLWKNTIPNASAVLFRKEAYTGVGELPLSFRLCGDWLVWVSMLQKYDICYTPDVLNSFRHHEVSVRDTTNKEKFDDEVWRVQKYILQEFKVSLNDMLLVLNHRLEVLDKSLPKWRTVGEPGEIIDSYEEKIEQFYQELSEKQAEQLRENKNVYLLLAKHLDDYGNKSFADKNYKLARKYYVAALNYNRHSARILMHIVSVYFPWCRSLLSRGM